MQSTTNYSMNLVEGTDLVNIPVQLNPNFQTVDAEMFKNKQSGIGTATEVVTGTVHAVVRSNTDADMFRFTATGAWTAGDTMTLDGSAVTVHLADGTAPATGAYIIGAEVVAVVNGTLVTLLTSNGAIDPGVTSFNTRIGAVTPAASDYDASMIDYDNTLSGLTSTDVQSAVDEVSALATNKAGFINTSNVITTIITYNADWEATDDCWCVGFARKNDAGANNPQVFLNNATMVNVTTTDNSTFIFPVKAGQHVKTRNDAGGTYSITIYSMI